MNIIPRLNIPSTSNRLASHLRSKNYFPMVEFCRGFFEEHEITWSNFQRWKIFCCNFFQVSYIYYRICTGLEVLYNIRNIKTWWKIINETFSIFNCSNEPLVNGSVCLFVCLSACHTFSRFARYTFVTTSAHLACDLLSIFPVFLRYNFWQFKPSDELNHGCFQTILVE